METQIVRLDAPYNLICGKGQKFGLHIATLIVITEDEEKKSPIVHNYPIVEGGHEELGGETWMNCELKDCKVVCQQGGKITFRDFRNVMKYFQKQGEILLSLIPMTLSIFISRNKIEILSPKDSSGNIINDYDVELVFEENEAVPNACLVHSSDNSLFFFETAFMGIPNNSNSKQDLIYKTAIDSMKRMRNAYYSALSTEGVKKISFFTKNGKYQRFVDSLNKD